MEKFEGPACNCGKKLNHTGPHETTPISNPAQYFSRRKTSVSSRRLTPSHGPLKDEYFSACSAQCMSASFNNYLTHKKRPVLEETVTRAEYIDNMKLQLTFTELETEQIECEWCIWNGDETPGWGNGGKA